MISFCRLSLLLLVVSVTAFAQQDLGNGWLIKGQVQLRSEVDGRDFSHDTHPLTFASSRIRLGVAKTFDEKISIFIQMQDSRVFGSESSTLSNSKNLDLHQGYLKLNKLFGWNWYVQAGRFEVSYGTQRFIGAVGWHYVGRSFDGVRVTVALKNIGFDIFALTVKESVPYIGNANPGVYPDPQEPTPAHSLYGFWNETRLNDKNKFNVFGYWEVNRFKDDSDNCMLSMPTLGLTYWGSFGRFSTIIEAAYQFGKMSGYDISAYLISASGYYKIKSAKLGIGVDILSGTDPKSNSNDMNTYQATYGTNHKFYGFMDYFINSTANTRFLGLNDFYLTSSYKPKDCKWSFGANFHFFMSNQSVKFTLDDSAPEDKNVFGQEIDLTVKYALVKGTTLVWGGSVFFPGDLMKAFFFPREDISYWTYVMVTANL
jgi:hypothetical protein